MFRTVPLPIIRSYPLYIRHWHMLYMFEDSLCVGSGWNLHTSCLQTCITCASAERTVDNSCWWAGELPKTCRVSYQNKFGKIGASFGFIVKKNSELCTISVGIVVLLVRAHDLDRGCCVNWLLLCWINSQPGSRLLYSMKATVLNEGSVWTYSSF